MGKADSVVFGTTLSEKLSAFVHGERLMLDTYYIFIRYYIKRRKKYWGHCIIFKYMFKKTTPGPFEFMKVGNCVSIILIGNYIVK